jgi:hypothetical protein
VLSRSNKLNVKRCCTKPTGRRNDQTREKRESARINIMIIFFFFFSSPSSSHRHHHLITIIIIIIIMIGLSSSGRKYIVNKSKNKQANKQKTHVHPWP